MAACDELLAPEVESRYPALWLRAALSASIPISGFRGPEAFVALATRCESRAVEMNDDYRLAVSRWLLGMSVETSRALVREAEQQHEPYVLALATVRLALDSALDEPSSARDALQAADAIASSYNSQYVRDYALAARGAQAIVFGDLSVGARRRPAPHQQPDPGDAGTRHLASRPRRPAVSRRGCRRTPPSTPANGPRRVRSPARPMKSTSPPAFSVCFEATLIDHRPELALDDPWLAARDSVDRGDIAAARLAIASLLPAARPARPSPMPSVGLSTTTKIDWHEALRIADQHGLRPIAVDALEDLAASAAAGDSFVEALRLLAAGERPPQRDRL